MQKIKLLGFSLLVIASMLLAACATPGQTPGNEIILPPGDLNSIPGQTVTTVQLGKTTYEECLAAMGGEANLVYGVNLCVASQPDMADILLLPVGALTKVTPGQQDDIVFYGVYYTKQGVKLAILLATAYLVGTQIAELQTPAQVIASDTTFPGVLSAAESEALSAIDNLNLTPVIEADWSNLSGALQGNGTFFPSTDHEESGRVIGILKGLTVAGSLSWIGSQCNYNCNGSLQIWGGVKGQYASVAMVYIATTKVVYVVCQGPLQHSDGIIPDSMVKLGGGNFVDPASMTYVAAFILAKTLHKAYIDSDALDWGEGMAAWQYKQQERNLFIPLGSFRMPDFYK